MHLVGLDIGFSLRKRTNAIAEVCNDKLELRRLSVAERNHALEELNGVDLLAIDAPILPSTALEDLSRCCEQTFCRGLFLRRCKPGMSHVKGTGRSLRQHGSTAAKIGCRSATAAHVGSGFPRVLDGYNVIEAFPNAFLGIAVDSAVYVNREPTRARKKFDWLYEQWLLARTFRAAVDIANLPDVISEACESERDHEKRAALVCLITAGFVAAGRFVAVGDSLGGFFFLPPAQLWAAWASAELHRVAIDTGAEIIRQC